MTKKSTEPRLVIPPKSPEMKRLFHRQVVDRLMPWMAARDMPPPKAGWIATIRQALGMSRTQLANRMGLDPTAIPHLERREVEGKITLESLRRAAEAMDAKVVYAIVPKESFATALRAQARKVARWRLGRVGHTMHLEAQDLRAEEAAEHEAELVNRLLVEWPQSLWDDLEGSKKRQRK